MFVGDELAVKRILKGKDLNVLHEDGPSALDWARVSGNKELIELLEQAGASR
jgi:hypothetical protein